MTSDYDAKRFKCRTAWTRQRGRWPLLADVCSEVRMSGSVWPCGSSHRCRAGALAVPKVCALTGYQCVRQWAVPPVGAVSVPEVGTVSPHALRAVGMPCHALRRREGGERACRQRVRGRAYACRFNGRRDFLARSLSNMSQVGTRACLKQPVPCA